MRQVFVLNAGLMKYTSGLQLQKRVSELVKLASTQNDISGILILIEHHPVYTIGIRSKTYTSELEQYLTSLEAEFIKTNRGGLITFHGPGQLVAYPILNLKHFKPDIRWYIHQLENTAISTCKYFHIKATTSPHTGVWVNDNKICAIGIHVSHYITTHGLGLNCNTNLDWFSHIVPCGIAGKGVTSLSREMDREITISDTIPKFLDSFSKCFNCQLTFYSQHEADKILCDV